MKKYKTYSVYLITKLKVFCSVKQKLSYWSFLHNLQWKRISKEYYYTLVNCGIYIILKTASSGVISMTLTKCLKLSKFGLQCKCLFFKGSNFCFKHKNLFSIINYIRFFNYIKKFIRNKK